MQSKSGVKMTPNEYVEMVEEKMFDEDEAFISAIYLTMTPDHKFRMQVRYSQVIDRLPLFDGLSRLLKEESDEFESKFKKLLRRNTGLDEEEEE